MDETHRFSAGDVIGIGGAQTRRGALTHWIRPAAASAALVGAGAGATAALARSSARLTHRDRQVLGFLVGLEQLESAFYVAALRPGRLTGEHRQFATIVGREERAHLHALVDLLGGHAPPAAHYRFGHTVGSNGAFAAGAASLEDTVVAAYNGQAENLSRHALGQVARIMSVESRHAAWARGLAGKLPAPVAADRAIDAAATMKALRPFLGQS